MLLGDVLARFDTPSFAEETVLALGDLNLLAGMRVRAEAEGESLGEFARNAVQRFAAEASDEEWVTMIGALARAEDPGSVCLRFALKKAVAPEAAGS
ncbi:MAG TPA: hypothetical protein VFP74_00295 [Pseudolabrys sp.]|jgi:hypothetical protein|nr:hypothetical protein [Pseudolabrys sp.]